jgi:hypothetical protein
MVTIPDVATMLMGYTDGEDPRIGFAGGKFERPLHALMLSKATKSHTIVSTGASGRIFILRLRPQRHIHKAPATSNTLTDTNQVSRGASTILPPEPDECGAVSIERIMPVLPLPAGMLGGVKEAVAPGGSPEAESATE